MGYLTGRADNREQYEEAWKSHLKDLRILFGAAGIPVDDWEPTLKPLRAIIAKAADNEFPETATRKLPDDMRHKLQHHVNTDDLVSETICESIDRWIRSNPGYENIVTDMDYVIWEIKVSEEIGE